VDRLQIAILIPAYNAAPTIGEIVSRCLPHSPRVLVVDDGSSDLTGSAAWEAGAGGGRHVRNRGKGEALRTGFRILAGEDRWEAILTLDADGQHEPSDIPFFLQAMERTGAGIVVGSRREHMGKMRPLRRFFNGLSSRCISGLCGREIEDTQSGFRLIRTQVLRELTVEGSRYDLEADLLIQASRAGFGVESIPISVPILNGLPTSHYRPFRDSYLIGLSILRHFLRR